MPSDRELVRRTCSDRDTRDLLLQAIAAGARLKRTKSGFIIFGPDGVTSLHTSRRSDRRGALNVAAQLRRIGLGKDRS